MLVLRDSIKLKPLLRRRLQHTFSSKVGWKHSRNPTTQNICTIYTLCTEKYPEYSEIGLIGESVGLPLLVQDDRDQNQPRPHPSN